MGSHNHKNSQLLKTIHFKLIQENYKILTAEVGIITQEDGQVKKTDAAWNPPGISPT